MLTCTLGDRRLCYTLLFVRHTLSGGQSLLRKGICAKQSMGAPQCALPVYKIHASKML